MIKVIVSKEEYPLWLSYKGYKEFKYKGIGFWFYVWKNKRKGFEVSILNDKRI